MHTETLIKGLIIGMENLGATFVKMDDKFVYFEFKEGAEIDDEQKLQRAKGVFKERLNLGLKIRKIK